LAVGTERGEGFAPFSLQLQGTSGSPSRRRSRAGRLEQSSSRRSRTYLSFRHLAFATASPWRALHAKRNEDAPQFFPAPSTACYGFSSHLPSPYLLALLATSLSTDAARPRIAVLPNSRQLRQATGGLRPLSMIRAKIEEEARWFPDFLKPAKRPLAPLPFPGAAAAAPTPGATSS
jgi:hypothetical protein